MTDSWVERIRAVPAEKFEQPQSSLAELSPLQRLRWLEQTAYFVWKHKGAARRLGLASAASAALPESTSSSAR